MGDTPKIPLSNCSLTQMRALLGLAVGDDARRPSLPALATNLDDLRGRLARLSRDDTEPAELLLEMACAADASLDGLTAIKERAKLLLDRAATPEDRGAATILYHVAIASGFLHHGRNLSSRPIELYLPLYDDLAAALRSGPMEELFRGAFRRGIEEVVRKDEGESGVDPARARRKRR
jgi:hypothetical protein